MLRADEDIERGCGQRIEGGVYLESATSPFGVDLEEFLMDPPIPYDPDSKLGVTLIEDEHGVTHVVDYVGSEHYPEAADVLEEGRTHGFSRRISKSIDLSKLSKDSKLFVLHDRGLVTNWNDVNSHFSDSLGGKDFSAECLWAMPRPEEDDAANPSRTIANTRYDVIPADSADSRAAFDEEAETTTALVAVLPITNVSVIAANDGSHVSTYEEKARQLDGKVRVHIATS